MSVHLLESNLKALKLPTFLESYEKKGEEYGREGKSPIEYLACLSEMETANRHQKLISRRMAQAHFLTIKSLDSFDFKALPNLEKSKVEDLARGDYISRHENVIAIGNSGTGKTHIATALGLAACQQGQKVCFKTASSLVHEMLEAHDERQLLKYKARLAKYQLLILDELGFVPLSKTGAELLFDIFSSRYEQRSIIVTTNLPFEEWPKIFGCERLTGALLDRLTHHVHILEMNGDSYRFNQSMQQVNNQKENKK